MAATLDVGLSFTIDSEANHLRFVKVEAKLNGVEVDGSVEDQLKHLEPTFNSAIDAVKKGMVNKIKLLQEN